MDNSNYFREIFESIPEYTKLVLSLFLIRIYKNLLLEIGFTELDINRVNLEFKNIFLEQGEKYLDYIKKEEESKIERFLNL